MGHRFQMLRFGSRFIFRMLEPDKNLHWQPNERRDRLLSHPNKKHIQPHDPEPAEVVWQ